MIEEYLPVTGFENNYEISNFGNIKSLARNNKKNHSILKQQISKHGGYLTVTLKKGRFKKLKSIHRLVAEAFIPNPKNLKEINHIDGIKLNNSITNLEWCTRSHNCKHAFDIGLRKPNRTVKAKKIIAINLLNGKKNEFISIRAAGRTLNLFSQNICAVLKGRVNKTGIYKFEYK